MTAGTAPSLWRAWWFLLGWSFNRQLRGHLLLMVALGLLGLTGLIVGLTTHFDRWNMTDWRTSRKLPTYGEQVNLIQAAGSLPGMPANLAAVAGAVRMPVEQTSGLFIFSNWIVFTLFSSFLLPMWTLTFATEALARERENRTLLWLFVRPLPRSALFLGKFLALLPWCLLLNGGGFFILCQLGGPAGRVAFHLYWPAVLLGTLAFAALFHLFAAWFRRASILALCYAFFLETIAGNLPGHFKRLSLSFYLRCMMLDEARDYGIGAFRPALFNAVSGTTAAWVLVGSTVLLLLLGTWIFSRKEYLDLN